MGTPHKHAEIIKAWADEFLLYKPDIGVFEWKKQLRGRAIVGNEAGRIVKGYRRIGIMGKEIQTHRLVWLFETGNFPEMVIDHIDGNPSNNKFSNLRNVTNQMNQHNQKKAHKTSSTKLLGAHVDKKRNCFAAKITLNNKTIYLGRFTTALEASERYLEAKNLYHPTCPKLKAAEVLK